MFKTGVVPTIALPILPVITMCKRSYVPGRVRSVRTGSEMTGTQCIPTLALGRQRIPNN